jgi:microcystin degradation protein MlrC
MSRTKARRVLFAGLFHETNTFVEQTTPLADFNILRDDELLSCAGDSSPLGGALESARSFGWEIIPAVDYRATPSGTVDDDAVERFWSEFEQRAGRHLPDDLDAIFLVLHGAMVSRGFIDVEGEILRRIRALPGAAGLRVFGVFDLHANFTAQMAANANCLVAYRENPHTDARQAAQIAAGLLERSLQTNEVPRMFWQHPPIMWSPSGTGTASEPMLALEKLARSMETGAPGIWSASVCGGFSFADTPDAGVSFAISAVAPETLVEEKLEQLSGLALKQRGLGNISEPTVEEVFKKLNPLPPGLTVLVEPSDNIGAGAPGDCTGLLRALIKFQIPNAAIAINDAEAVKALQLVAIGGTATLSIGGKGSSLDEGPLPLQVTLVSRSDGKFQLEDKQSHLASMLGDSVDMGSSAVVTHNGISILLTSKKAPPFDLGQWRSQGIEPTKLSVIGVKAAVAHRRAYDPIAQRMFWVDTPGPCSSYLHRLPYRRIRRPVYPLDTI